MKHRYKTKKKKKIRHKKRKVVQKKTSVVKKKLSAKLLKEYKQKLVAKYKELVGIKKNINLFSDIGDEADIAADVLEQEILQELTDTQRTILDLITRALEKIKNKTYGFCEKCGNLISKKRLDALPWARYCIVCQNNIEK